MLELNFLAHSLDLIFQQIVDGMSISELIVQSNGVRQGGGTSPFLIYFAISDINDIIQHFNSEKCKIMKFRNKLRGRLRQLDDVFLR